MWSLIYHSLSSVFKCIPGSSNTLIQILSFYFLSFIFCSPLISYFRYVLKSGKSFLSLNKIPARAVERNIKFWMNLSQQNSNGGKLRDFSDYLNTIAKSKKWRVSVIQWLFKCRKDFSFQEKKFRREMLCLLFYTEYTL